MQNDESKFTKARGIAHYKSGRTEEFSCVLKKDKTPTNVFNKKLSSLRSFPTVKRVEVIKF